MVTGVMYRHPGALVKQVTTLDVLSGGRAWLGIGAGWYEREARGLGLPFPRVKERFELLEETLRIAKHMWRNDTSPIYGKHYSLAEPLSSPAPLQSAAPADPDWRWWGAQNAPPRRALRGRVQPVRAVRRGRADVASWTSCGQHCETEGRDYDTHRSDRPDPVEHPPAIAAANHGRDRAVCAARLHERDRLAASG